MQAVCNRISTIHEMRAAFGRKHRQPKKVGGLCEEQRELV
jgi:hypothetical protein